MAQKPINRHVEMRHTLPVGTPNRALYFNLHGAHNKPDWPSKQPESPLSLSISDTSKCVAWAQNIQYPPGSRYVSLDAPNIRAYAQAHANPWDSRLYASAYSSFVEKARQGSSEWGMNIVHGRKTLATFVQLALTAGTTVAAFCLANRAGLQWLKNHSWATPNSVEKRRRKLGRHLVRAREASERRRLSNEIWILDQVSSTLLAYRYGVKPLMEDLYNTAQVLSGEFTEVVHLRKSAKRPWNASSQTWDDSWTGEESVTLRATVSVSNPNLLLANRLGLINPQVWIWDATPWSFVGDWWFPVGSFLQNFTALVGLSLSGSSATHTRAWTGTWRPYDPYGKILYKSSSSMKFHGKRKVRVAAPLPIPLTVPYGTGLGIQRGQNALALIAQRLVKK